MRDLEQAIRRNSADGVAETVRKKGPIQISTLVKLLDLLATKTDYRFHIELAVEVGALTKTLDNEVDALETIRRLEAK